MQLSPPIGQFLPNVNMFSFNQMCVCCVKLLLTNNFKDVDLGDYSEFSSFCAAQTNFKSEGKVHNTVDRHCLHVRRKNIRVRSEKDVTHSFAPDLSRAAVAKPGVSVVLVAH